MSHISNKRIILVDDEENILTSLSLFFSIQGFEIETYSNSVDALEVLISSPPDLAILDVKMPTLTGMDVLSRVRSKGLNYPIILLTSKDEEIDELLGFRLGADDYIHKPFSQKLLLERTRVLLRKAQAATPVPASATASSPTFAQAPREQIATPSESPAYNALAFNMSPPNPDEDQEIVRGNLALNPLSYTCKWKGKLVRLTVTEFLLVLALARYHNRVKTRNQLMEACYGDSGDPNVDSRTIDTHIKRLRKKFRALDSNFDQIETLYGIGYRLK